jgi:hypothetical protein
VRRRAAAQHEQLHQAVEGGRVGDVVAQQPADLVDVVAEQGRGEGQLAGAMPVAVAAQGVDLAVVGEVAVGVRELPAREGVGREARVDQGEPRDQAPVLEVWEVLGQLGRGEHALVDERAGGEAGDRQRGQVVLLDAAPDHVELALEGVLVGQVVRGRHEQLADARRHGAGGDAAVLRHHRHVAPAEHPLPLFFDVPLDQALGVLAGPLVARQEADRDPVAPGVGQLEVELLAEEAVRRLQQDAGAVAGVRVRTLGPAVLEVLERPQRPRDHLVRGGRAQVRDERDAAGVVLVAGVVKAARGPDLGRCHRRVPGVTRDLGFARSPSGARNGVESRK